MKINSFWKIIYLKVENKTKVENSFSLNRIRSFGRIYNVIIIRKIQTSDLKSLVN